MTKNVLTVITGVIALGLCGVCVVQWNREHRLNAAITEITNRLQKENLARVEFEEKSARLEQEIARITELRRQTEAALAEASENVLLLTDDMKGRGGTIAAYINLEFGPDPDAAAEPAEGEPQAADVVKERNAAVEAQNAAITKANAAIKKLAGERDAAIEKLNARIRAFNELTEKYNRLAAKS